MESSAAISRLEYLLLNYGEQKIFTRAPLHEGDVVMVRSDEGGPLEERIVARIEFAESTADAGTGVYSAFVHFEKKAERVGGV